MVFVALLILSYVIGTGLDKIADALDVLADHLEHSCDKCKAGTESEDVTATSPS